MTLVGAEPDQYQAHSVQTRDQLEALIADSEFSHPTRLQVSPSLKICTECTLSLAASTNRYTVC